MTTAANLIEFYKSSFSLYPEIALKMQWDSIEDTPIFKSLVKRLRNLIETDSNDSKNQIKPRLLTASELLLQRSVWINGDGVTEPIDLMTGDRVRILLNWFQISYSLSEKLQDRFGWSSIADVPVYQALEAKRQALINAHTCGFRTDLIRSL